jgi:four helix bundle protein
LTWGYAPEGTERRFPAHFLSKLTDVDGEASETWHWLETANACGYLDEVRKAQLIAQLEGVCRMLGRMMHKADTFVPPRTGKAAVP